MFPTAPRHMLKHKNTTIKNFGYDSETKTDYYFNSLGYRSNCEFEPNREKPIYVLGNTMSFGLGVEFENTYGYLLSKGLGRPVYNFSWGCYGHTNLEQINFLEKLLEVHQPYFIIFQINNLNRSRDSSSMVHFKNEKSKVLSLHKQFMTKAKTVLERHKHAFLYWDDEHYDIDLPKNCIVHNRYFVDSALKTRRVIGQKSHKLISLKILDHLKKSYE